MEHDFRIYAALDAFEKAGDENPMRIGGIVSTARLDLDEERVVQEGLDFSPFLRSGWFNDNHGQKTSDVLGYPTGARYIKAGEPLPNGKVAGTNGWWTEGYLLNTDEGRKVWALAQSLRDTPRKLGFSIEGKVTRRNPKDQSVVQAAVVRNVAVTHCPKNWDTELTPLAKALTAGTGVGTARESGTPGAGGALRVQSLEGSPLHPDAPDDDEKKPKKKHLSSPDDGGEPNNGGIAGESPHDDAVKAEVDHDFAIVDETDHVEDWADAASDFVRETSRTRLTKAEAVVIVKRAYPNLAPEQVSEIVNRATTRSP